MVLEAALPKRAQQVREGLAELFRLVNSGGASTMDGWRVLSESESFAAQVAVLQADAAALTPTDEPREIMQECKESSAKLAEFEERAEATLAAIEHQGGDDAAVA